MRDPYEVLGVPHTASDDDVKKAYRELARKYHPDNYHDNPLSDLAQEKMKEINEAYDAVTRQRATGGGFTGSVFSGGGGFSGGSASARRSTGTPTFAEIRAAINRGDLNRAEMLLGSTSDRSAEWHFLTGSLYYRRGWMDEAAGYFDTAARMEPSNPEYRQAMTYMHSGGMSHHPYGGMQQGPDPCKLCAGLCAADCCCELCGGDLICCL